MAEEKKPAEKKAAAPAEKRKPTAADLKAAAAQLEEQETGVRKNTAILRVIAFVLWALAAVAITLPSWSQMVPLDSEVPMSKPYKYFFAMIVPPVVSG